MHFINLLKNNIYNYILNSGSWLSHIEFESELYWSITDEALAWDFTNSKNEILLPSDSTVRKDI